MSPSSVTELVVRLPDLISRLDRTPSHGESGFIILSVLRFTGYWCLFVFKLVCACVCMPNVCRRPWRQEESVSSDRAGVTDSCEPSDVSAGNQTLIFLKSGILLTAKPSLLC